MIRLRLLAVLLLAVLLLAVLLAVLVVVVAGCSSPGVASAAADRPAGGAAYWTVARLLAAQAMPGTAGSRAAVSSSARTSLDEPRVGALFLRAGNGNHYCTASVVTSPDRDLLITAAHCINGGDGGGYRSDVVFIPDYRDGRAPYGIWTPARLVVASGWVRSAAPDLDVGFVVLKPRNGKNIEQVLGADTLLFNAGYRFLVRVTGYPQSSGEPITCKNWTTRQSASQLKFSCDGFANGTSGSPWVTDFDPATRTGRVVGVIGGYQQGGDTAAVSYSAYFGTAISQLYHEAISP